MCATTFVFFSGPSPPPLLYRATPAQEGAADPGGSSRWSRESGIGRQQNQGEGSAMERELAGSGMATMEGNVGMSVQGKPEFGVEKKGGLRFPRVFTRAGSNPFDEVEWEDRTAGLSNEHG